MVACSFDGSVPGNGLSPDGAPIVGGDGSTFDGAPVGGDDGGGEGTETDMDGDQILDEFDNCPTVFNANQFNEDGDSHGNLCDNCPAEDNQGQANADADGLGDACDPQPSQANDLLYFEGFDQIPDAGNWDGLGSWEVAGGSLVQSDNSQRYYLRYDGVDGSDKVRVVAKLQFSSPLGSNGVAFRYGGVFVEGNGDPDNNGCWVVRSLSQSVEGYSGVSVNNGSPSANFPVGPNVVDNSDYVVASTVDGSTRSCSFEHAADTPESFNYSGSNANGQGLGIVTSYTRARVAYVYAVGLQ